MNIIHEWINDEWINQMWYNHTTEYNWARKRNKAVTRATTWVNLENMRLNEITSQSQEATWHTIPLIKCPELVNPQRQK